VSTAPEPGPRELDVVLFGATGFTGRLVAAHLSQHAPPSVQIGLAGRSPDRLRRVRAGLGPAAADWPLLVADSGTPATLADLAARSRVVATTVGPYARHGLPLVQACALAGTHYADLTGEVLFVRRSIDQWHEVAAGSGARVVHACGFDSIPSDLAVLLLHQAVRADGAGELGSVTLVAKARGGASGGTVESIRGQVDAVRRDPSALRLVRDPHALSPDRDAEPHRPSQRDDVRVRFDRRAGQWVGPFVMGPFNTRVVRRSNALQGWAYGRGLDYREVMGFGRRPGSPVVAVGATAAAGVLVAGLLTPGVRTLLDRALPAPGEGPDEASRARGYFRMTAYAQTTTGARYVATVAAQGHPGYAATAVMLGESALALALGPTPSGPVAGGQPAGGGVLTPATGIGATLVDRLRLAGFELSVARQDGQRGRPAG
jgi:short subunit dehydrogenase-like uncharacterized protein